MRSWQNISWGCSHLRAWLRLENQLPLWLTYMAIGRRPQFLITWASSYDCLSVLMTWQLGFPRVRDWERARRKPLCLLCPHPRSHAASHPPHSIPQVTKFSLEVREQELVSILWRQEYQRIGWYTLKPPHCWLWPTLHWNIYFLFVL